jgi:hypothetical protein
MPKRKVCPVTVCEELLPSVKANLQIEDDADDTLLLELIGDAVSYAEDRQNKRPGTYCALRDLPRSAKRAVILLVSHWYESRDGGTGGYYASTPAAAEQVMKAVSDLLRLKREMTV